MKRITLRFAIAALTFVVGISAAALWLIYRKPANPNQNSSAAVADPPLSFCDLVQNAERFNSKVVRVRAILIGYHEIALYDSSCGSDIKYIRADFDADSRQQLIKAIDSLNGAGFRNGNFWANFVLSGHFEKIPDCRIKYKESGMPSRNHINYCYRLVVSKVEHVEAVASTIAWPE
jgi:hypothetical protein